jgi:hypothetical protein
VPREGAEPWRKRIHPSPDATPNPGQDRTKREPPERD